MNDFVPERAIVPKLLIKSVLVIPIPLSKNRILSLQK